MIAVFRRDDLPRTLPSDNLQLGLALWHVADPGNVGTLIRTADAFGAFVALSSGCADPTSPKALRGSAGAIFRVPLLDFDEAPTPRIALVAEGGQSLGDIELGEQVTFLLGAERAGLPAEVLERCDAVASIPMEEGAESLNVAVAGAIALYEHRRSNRSTLADPSRSFAPTASRLSGFSAALPRRYRAPVYWATRKSQSCSRQRHESWPTGLTTASASPSSGAPQTIA